AGSVIAPGMRHRWPLGAAVSPPRPRGANAPRRRSRPQGRRHRPQRPARVLHEHGLTDWRAGDTLTTGSRVLAITGLRRPPPVVRTTSPPSYGADCRRCGQACDDPLASPARSPRRPGGLRPGDVSPVPARLLMKRLIRVPPSAHVDAGGSVIRRRDRNGVSMASTKVADYILQRL